jgi:hypothetical protein
LSPSQLLYLHVLESVVVFCPAASGAFFYSDLIISKILHKKSNVFSFLLKKFHNNPSQSLKLLPILCLFYI